MMARLTREAILNVYDEVADARMALDKKAGWW